jgi:hypothetical protein
MAAIFPGTKQQGHEADHSPAFSAEIKNEGSYTSTPTHVFNACTRTTSLYHWLAQSLASCPPSPASLLLSVYLEDADSQFLSSVGTYLPHCSVMAYKMETCMLCYLL